MDLELKLVKIKGSLCFILKREWPKRNCWDF